MRLTPAASISSFRLNQSRSAAFLRGGFAALLFALFLGGVAWAQAPAPYDPVLDQGLLPFRSYGGGDIDKIDLATGKLTLHIPIASYPQRGGVLHLDLFVPYTNPSVYEFKIPDEGVWEWLGSGLSSPQSSYIATNDFPTFTDTVTPTGPGTFEAQGSVSAGQISDGSSHPMGWLAGSTSNSAQLRALDASGFYVNTSDDVIDSNGIVTAETSTGWTSTDPNGNQMILNTSNGTITDTMGRVITLETAQDELPGPNGTTQTYVWSGTRSGTLYNATLTLPNGTAYTFQFTSVTLPLLTGQTTAQTIFLLAEITLPTGGTISYTYPSAPRTSGCGLGVNTYFPVATRTVNANDGTGPHTWTYSYTFPTSETGTGTATVTDPLRNVSIHTFGLDECKAPFETELQSYDNAGNLLETVSTNYSSVSAPDDNFVLFDVVPTSVVTTWPNGQQKKVTYTYDTSNGQSFTFAVLMNEFGVTTDPTPSGYTTNLFSIVETDYGGATLRTTTNAYQAFTNSAYLTANLLDALYSTKIANGSGTQAAYTYYGYDEAGSPSGAHGNQTSIHRWLNTTGGYLVTSNVYDSYGRVTSTTDPRGSTTTLAYSTPCYAGSGPTSSTNALSQVTNYCYDANTGLLTLETDPNKQPTSYSYDSETWRKTSVTYPDGGKTAYCYSDTPSEGCTSGPPYQVTVTKAITSSLNLVEIGIVDGLGRTSEFEISSDPTGPDYTVITYDADGRKYSETNPYRTTSDPTYGVTYYKYDALNRTILVTEPDNSAVSTVYTGSCATVTDEAGNTRESCEDGLGRKFEVYDNPGGLNYITSYGYDALDDLTSVLQGSSRSRSLVYDSLGRMTGSTNPETGTVTYTYDGDGNVLTKTDARGIMITYSWDALNRMLGKTYSNGDSSVTYTYDQTTCVVVPSCYNVGRLTSMTDAAGTESFSYDTMGRLWGDKRTTAGITKDASYTYNLDGSIGTMVYPSGSTVAYTPGGAELPLQVVDSATGVSATDVEYTPWGARSYSALGLKFSERMLYNVRMQPCWTYAPQNLTLTSCTGSYTTGEYIDLKYNWNLGADNGNLIGITNDINSNRSQTYGYDAVNRITSAGTLSTCTTDCWSLTFSPDQWGNILSTTGTGAASAASFTVQVGNTNQITSSPFTYDAAGNLLTDITSSYAWNGEGQMKTGGGVSYLYDGKGNRVEKFGEKLYWYGASGEVLDETDATGSISDAAFSEYVYLDGQRIARSDNENNVYYYFEDQVRSSREIAEIPTSGSAALCYDADFFPYGGEEDFANNCAQNYKFTGKERDSETGNDYFGARFYSSTFGRFLSPDWSDETDPVPYADEDDPQTLNLYAYVRSNPLSATDSEGHACVSTDGGKTFHDDDSGGETCAQANDPANNNTSSAEVSACYYCLSNLLHKPTAEETQQMDEAIANGQIKFDEGTLPIGPGDLEALGELENLLEDLQSGLKPTAESPVLQKIIDQLFKTTDKVPGGTAGAVRQELESGEAVGEKFHSIKAAERARQLEKLVNTGTLSAKDTSLATAIMQDLRNALAGK